jgi:hypothetical protein
MLVQHTLCRGQNYFAFGRETYVVAIALNYYGRKLLLQCPQSVGQSRLRDMAGLRRPPEMAVLVQSDQIAQAGQ